MQTPPIVTFPSRQHSDSAGNRVMSSTSPPLTVVAGDSRSRISVTGVSEHSALPPYIERCGTKTAADPTSSLHHAFRHRSGFVLPPHGEQDREVADWTQSRIFGASRLLSASTQHQIDDCCSSKLRQLAQQCHAANFAVPTGEVVCNRSTSSTFTLQSQSELIGSAAAVSTSPSAVHQLLRTLRPSSVADLDQLRQERETNAEGHRCSICGVRFSHETALIVHRCGVSGGRYSADPASMTHRKYEIDVVGQVDVKSEERSSSSRCPPNGSGLVKDNRSSHDNTSEDRCPSEGGDDIDNSLMSTAAVGTTFRSSEDVVSDRAGSGREEGNRVSNRTVANVMTQLVSRNEEEIADRSVSPLDPASSLAQLYQQAFYRALSADTSRLPTTLKRHLSELATTDNFSAFFPKENCHDEPVPLKRAKSENDDVDDGKWRPEVMEAPPSGDTDVVNMAYLNWYRHYQFYLSRFYLQPTTAEAE